MQPWSWSQSIGVVWLVGLTLGTVAGAADDQPIPWPRSQPPAATELDEKLSAAVELFELERTEEFLEAWEFGEESEHIFILQEQIDRGRYSVEQLFVFGDSTFEHEFRERDGYGDANNLRLVRVHDGERGGLDAYACAGCHAVGGVNGSGTATANAFYFGDGQRLSSAIVRNAPAVLGLGYVQQLGHEMSTELLRARDRGLQQAHASGKSVHVPLLCKDVSFGSLVAHPDQSIDFAGLEGIDRDLIVKPFGWKGHTARLRRFAERAALIHFGIQSHVLAIEHRDDPDPGLLGAGHKWWDPDADDRQRELEEGAVTALAIYLALLEVPVVLPPHDPNLRRRWASGSRLFDKLGCVDCHRRSLVAAVTNVSESPDTTGGPSVSLQLGSDGEKPRIDQAGVPLFSDLKRHDMGPELADSHDDPDGVGRQIWLTRPLWGLAETPPYLHDGRASNILEAIRAHGGEAASQQAAFVALPEEQQADLHIFLLSLTREPKLRVER